jgi:hypothetical protein
MPLKLVVNNSKYCRVQGKRYSRDILRENKEIEEILNLRILLREKYNDLLYTEILLTKREESLREEEKQKKYEKTYNEFMESLRRIREERELKESLKNN